MNHDQVVDYPVIQVRNLRKEFKLGSESVEVLCGVALVVRRGEMVSIIGPSGSGKSNLIHCEISKKRGIGDWL